jgi:hypothetical protein
VTFAVAGAAVVLWRRREGSAVVTLALLPVAGAATLWAAGEPIFNERNLLPVAPFLAIMVAAAVAELPAHARPFGAAAGIALTLIGAGYAQLTLGRVAYDSVARTVESFGWTARDGIVVAAPNAAIQIASPVAWYLPGHPELIWRRSKHECLTRFAIVQVREPQAWLARYPVAAARVFTYYDHPILGRRHGNLVVARFRRATRVSGAFFYRRVAPWRPQRRRCTG